MPKRLRFRRCRLQRGLAVRTAWLPTKVAKPQATISLRMDDGWSDWYVRAAFDDYGSKPILHGAHDRDILDVREA